MLDLNVIEVFSKTKTSKLPILGTDHIARVKKTASLLSSEINPNQEILQASILLHTIGAEQWLKYRQDYIATSRTLAKYFLERNNTNSRTLEAILHCIDSHPLDATPRSEEAKILHDAYAFELSDPRAITHISYILGRELKPLRTLLPTLSNHISLLETTFTTEKAKQLATPKIEALKEIYLQFEKDLKPFE